MLTIPTSYYLAFETIQNIEEYFEGKVNVEKHVELVELSKQIVILTVHNAKCFSMQWQAFSSVNVNHPPELSIVHSIYQFRVNK
jgi:hypothetical protein